MAFDKVVDSAVLEAGLTSIANAIREKGGASGTLAFPDGMAEAIAAIEAGGSEEYEIKSGTITLVDTIYPATTPFDIEHGLSGEPCFFFAAFGLATSKPGNYISFAFLTTSDFLLNRRVPLNGYLYTAQAGKDTCYLRLSDDWVSADASKVRITADMSSHNIGALDLVPGKVSWIAARRLA